MTISSVKTGDDGYDVNVTNTPLNTDRALVCGGFNGSSTRYNTIDYVSVSSTGNAIDFGDLSSTARWGHGACSSNTRLVNAGGLNNSDDYVNAIDYVTIATLGNAIEFGSLASFSGHGTHNGTGNNLRGLFGGWNSSAGYKNDIQYLTIATKGNAVDFGDLTSARANTAGLASPTRAVWGGGDGGSASSTIDYVTIATTGNATNFGSLTTARNVKGAFSSLTRGVFLNSSQSPANVVDYITIASTGNATDFGDATDTRNAPAGTGNKTRGLGMGGSASNVIDYVTIATTGNFTDFGDLTVSRGWAAAGSGSHGGIDDTQLQFTETPSPQTEASQGIGAFFTSGDSSTNHIDYVDISSGGNSTDAGDLTVSRGNGAAVGSTTRAIHAGGENASGNGARYNTIDYALFSSTGNAVDFGDLQTARRSFGSANDSTRGIFYGGSTDGSNPTKTNQIDYITMASTGNALDFGDAATSAYYASGGASNGTRACFSGGYNDTTDTNVGKIEYLTIQTLGNGTNFGDQSQNRRGCGGASSHVRGIWFGGYTTNQANTIDYITIATTGNATDFGDLTGTSTTGALSSKIKAIVSMSGTMNVVTIATTGNATTSGTRTGSRSYGPGTSNSHGGI